MSLVIEQEHYSGPLALLLELIDERKLEITKVSIAQVADAFLARMATMEVSEEEMADFLLVAARLIYLKSKELLPEILIDEEEEADRLEDRLRAYQEFVHAAKRLGGMWGRAVMYGQKYKKEAVVQEFLPAKNVTQEKMHDAFTVIIRRLAPFFALREQRMTRTVSLEERVRALRAALQVKIKMAFHEIIDEKHEREDVVVTFLALLDLLRQKEIVVHQEHAFGKMIIEHKTNT